MRLALPLAIAVLLAGLVAGCGGGSSNGSSGGGATGPSEGGAPAGAASATCGGTVRVTGVPCARASAVVAAWQTAPGCRIAGGASHAACRVRGYLCIAARQGERAVVSCALPGRSILFRPGP